MKANIRFNEKTSRCLLTLSVIIVSALLLIMVPACQKYQGYDGTNESPESSYLKSVMALPLINSPQTGPQLLFGPKKFYRTTAAPVVSSEIIDNKDFECFDNAFILNIRNGESKESRVSSAEIWIDGEMIAGPSDFSKNVTSITKKLTELERGSVLEVKLNSSPGSFVEIWIEGIITLLNPSFIKIGPLCQNSIPPVLPSESADDPSIKGNWEPALISTAIPGKYNFTFIPDEGQCANKVSMEIEVIENITPIFDQIGPVLQGLEAPALPGHSKNGVAGTWSPDKINTSSTGTFTYTFTPNPGVCALPVTMDIVVTNKGKITDIDGNIYNTLRIGEQWWMTENLKTMRYNNSEPIQTTSPATLDVTSETNPSYQWAYNGIESNASVYGRLYTWYVAADARGVCPTGWHVPTDAEWTILSDYLINNGYGFEGSGNDIAKSLASSSGWTLSGIPGNVGNDQASNNSSGFTMLPGGVRYSSGIFSIMGAYASMWSSTERSAPNVWFRSIQNNLNYLNRGNSSKKHAAAIRCIMNSN